MSFDGKRLTRVSELRALAHPLRLAIVEQLGIRGPMTASDIGDVLDETPANCSWHLRKLAEQGLVEETHEGTGRRRPWRVTSVGLTWDERGDDPRNHAGRALTDRIVEREVERFRQNREHANDWDVVGASQNATWMTEDEAQQWRADLTEVAMRFHDRIADPDKRPDGARLIHALVLASVDPEVRGE